MLRQKKQQRNGGSKDRQGGSGGALFNSKGSDGASQIDGVARMAALQTLHKAYAVTGAVFLRAAAKVEVL